MRQASRIVIESSVEVVRTPPWPVIAGGVFVQR
jgi:hypothetical protein